MVNNLNLPNKNECTGCALCANICPCNALLMKEDTLGFLYPELDSTLCINCHKCECSCPVNNFHNKNFDQPTCYVAMADDNIRELSSSGGVFTVLSQKFFELNGIVLGVALEETMDANYYKAECPGDLSKLRGSKYVQSNLQNAYEILLNVDANKPILITGTPCQIAALITFANRHKIPNIFTLDLVCHGVMSSKMLRSYITHDFPNQHITKVYFRDKANGWVSNCLTVMDSTSAITNISFNESLFEKCYHQNVALCSCCYACKFSKFPRVGDITLSDFWGIGEFDATFDDGKGTSCVLINSHKGKVLFDSIFDNLPLCKEVPLYLTRNNRINLDLDIPNSRYRLERLSEKKGLYSAMEQCQKMKYDIALVGCWTIENYGSNLTYYALYRFLKNNNFEVLMVERPESAIWKPKKIPEGFKHNPYDIGDISRIYENKYEMQELNNFCDTFLLGSDQMFYHDLYRSFDQIQNLDFVHSGKTKIAYAASIGRLHFDGTDDEKKSLAFWLKQYDAISTREESSINLFKKEFGVDSILVVDPVFLCDINEYNRIADHGQSVNESPYISAYILDNSFFKSSLINYIKNTLHMPVFTFYDVIQGKNTTKIDSDVLVEDNETWLRSIRDSDLFIADSYHGICFAIIYKKNFICLVNKRRGAERFHSLLKKLGLENRMIYETKNIDQKLLFSPINYDIVYEKLIPFIENSKKWLLSALQIKTKNSWEYRDIVNSSILEIKAEQKFLRWKTLNNERWISTIDKRLGELENRISFMDQRLGQAEKNIASFSITFNQRIENIDERLGRAEEVEASISLAIIQNENRTTSIEERIGKAEEVAASISQAIIQNENRTTSIDERLGRTEEVAASISEALIQNENRTTSIDERLGRTEEVAASISEAVIQNENRTTSIDERLGRTEEVAASISEAIIQNENRTSGIEERLKKTEDVAASVSQTFEQKRKFMILKKFLWRK